MKSPIAGLFVALCITAIAASAAPAPAPAPAAKPKLSKWQQHQLDNFKNSAPADEYFGRMKMSYLGMNNTFRDAAISSGEHTTDSGIINKVGLAEDALNAWANKYPRDPQLARTYFLATQVDRKIWVKANQDRAWIYLNRLVQQFPTTYFGKVLKRDLAIGFTEHYYALPLPCATPSPTASPSGEASAETATTLTDAAPADTPVPTPAPTTSPSPGPTETTLTRGLKVQIIPQPCVPPPSPSPSPSPTASPMPPPAPSEPSASIETPAPSVAPDALPSVMPIGTAAPSPEPT